MKILKNKPLVKSVVHLVQPSQIPNGKFECMILYSASSSSKENEQGTSTPSIFSAGIGRGTKPKIQDNLNNLRPNLRPKIPVVGGWKGDYDSIDLMVKVH